MGTWILSKIGNNCILYTFKEKFVKIYFVSQAILLGNVKQNVCEYINSGTRPTIVLMRQAHQCTLGFSNEA